MWLLLLLFSQWCLLLTRRGVSTVLPALLATPSSPWSKFWRRFKLNYESLKALCRLSHVICLTVFLCSLSRFFSLSSIWDCLLLLPNCFFLTFLLCCVSDGLFLHLTFLSSSSCLVPLFPFPLLHSFPFIFSLCPSCLPPLSHFHLCFLPALSGISLWRWIWSRCANTAMSASLMTWNVGWPSENVTQKRRRRNWYPCVCDPSLSALSLLQLIFPLVSFFFLLSMPLLILRSLIHWVQLASKAWNKNTSREL